MCDPVKNRVIFYTHSIDRKDKCEQQDYILFGTTDENGVAFGNFRGVNDFMYKVKKPLIDIYVSNKIGISKYEERKSLLKGNTCKNREDIVFVNPSVQSTFEMIMKQQKEQIEKDKKFVLDLIEFGTVNFGDEFVERSKALEKKNNNLREEFENKVAIEVAENLISDCRSEPSDENCEKMMRYIKNDLENPSQRLVTSATKVYVDAQKIIDETLWNNSYPLCSNPKNSDSCAGVKHYLIRFENGNHIDEAKSLLQKMMPILQRFAAEEEKERKKQEQRKIEEATKIFLICVGTCMGNGGSRNTCEYKCKNQGI